MRGKRKRKPASPAQILVFGFLGMIIVGTILLSLPAASANGKPLNLIDALFTATSGVCVTGLAVFDPGSTLSIFGQAVLLILIQLGGLGFMTLTSIVYMIMGRRITLKDRMVIRDSFNDSRLQGVVRMTRNAVLITACAETAGVLLLMLRFVPMYGAKGVYYSIFHAISSFCNAGFDVFGQNSNLIPFVNDPLVNIVTMLLIIFGGLGFFVIAELSQRVAGRPKTRKLTLHTRLVLMITGILILGGFLVFFAAESMNPETLGAPGVPMSEKVLGALFQSVTSRTAGFSTINQHDLTPISKIVTNGLMFVGASPAGTGGGIKTTTAALVVLFIISILKGTDDIELMKRRINREVARRALAIFTLGIVFVLAVTCVMAVIEYGHTDLRNIAFEVTSAFGTVGLSTGITPTLAPISKFLLTIVMFGGRVGIFTLTLALARQIFKPKLNVRYPEDTIMIG